MIRKTLLLIGTLVVAGSLPGVASAQAVRKGAPVVAPQQRGNYPRLRAALQELREARREVRDAKDGWPPAYRDRATKSIGDAIDSVKTILEVKDVENFRGIDRNPDYYKRYRDHPRLRSAVQDLRDARSELQGARVNAPNLKDRAIDDIDIAIGDLLTLIRYQGRPDRR